MSKRRTEPSVETATANLTSRFVEMVSEQYSLRDKHGDKVEFDLVPGRAVYTYLIDPRGWLHCYTPWKDTKGRFWVWSYKPVGRGARTGEASDFVIVRPRWFRHRHMAKRTAQDRFKQGGGQS